jgi:NADPH:quinone reductase-like Zn-dependent oxidoreductase
MQAIVQDKYGSSRVLALRSIDKPEIGVDDVLVRVRAAGVHIGDLHVMTGQPYLMRIVGFGLRAPKARVRGMDVAGRWKQSAASQRLRPVLATPNTNDLVVLKQLIETAVITPMIGRTYTLSETSDAIRQLEEGHARGKVVITV